MLINFRFFIIIFALTCLGIIIYFFLNSQLISFLWSSILIEIQSLQRGFHLKLSQSIRDIQTKGIVASIGLISLSFLYGIFHAVGPGHGKIVISTYLLTQESKLKKGIFLSLASSMVQGLTAILLITISVFFLDYTMRETNKFANDVELISFTLIAIVGAIIAFSRLKKIYKSLKIWVEKTKIINHNKHKKTDHSHNHSHTHFYDYIDSNKSLLGIIISVGIRPCSGAIIVLLLANSINLELAGIFAVLSMSFGTGLTTSFLAALSVYGRKSAIKLLSFLPEDFGTLQSFINWIGLIGGIIIFLFGFILIKSTLLAPPHPFL